MSSLLHLPLEIRLKIYALLLGDRTIVVEPESSYDTVDDGAQWRMKRIPDLHPSILRVSKQIYHEAHPLLYSSNCFDVSQRDGLDLLRDSVVDLNIALIKSIMLDWDQLEPFAWSLNSTHFLEVYAGIEQIDMLSWRTRILGGKSAIWQQSKSYERQLVQAAADILRKHPKLGMLVQRSHHKAPMHARSNNSSRVKWRFISGDARREDREIEVDLGADLEILRAREDDVRVPQQTMMDAF